VPAGRECRLGAAGDRGDGLAAVGLMADDDHDFAASLGRFADVHWRGARREPLVDVGIPEIERGCRLPCAEQWARDHDVGTEPLLAQLPTERSGLLTAGGGQRPQLVRVSRRRLGVTNDHELHRGQDNRVMARLGGPAGALAVFALTVGLAFDGGGFQPVAVDRALVGVSALALLVVVLLRGERPGRVAGALLAALGLLVAWTAASWLWSDSPPVALQEAQRAALYFAVAATVVLAGRRVPLAWICGGVAGGATVAAIWNLGIRLAPDWLGRSTLRTDIGQLADPVGYANSLALLAAVGLVLVLGIDGLAVVAMVPLAAVIALQQSTGTAAALALGLLAYLLTAERPLRAVALLVLPLAAALVVSQAGSVVDPPPADLLSAAHRGHRLVVLLVVLMIAQAVVVRVRLRAGNRVAARAARWIAGAVAVLAIAAAPFALAGHERGQYWRVGMHEIAANPLLGSGAGTFVDWWLRLRTVPQSTLEAHSLYLETLAELGPLGLALVLATVAAGIAGAWRLRRDAIGPAVLAALVTYAVAAAADFHWELAAATAPAIVLGASAAVHADGRSALVRNRYAVPLLAGLTIAGLLALAGNVALDSGDPQRALRFAPYSSEAWKAIGASRCAAGDTRGAAAAYRKAVELDPNDWRAWTELAPLVHGEPRRLASARAARLNPLGPEAP